MASTSTNLHDNLIEAGFDAKQATVLAHAIATPVPPAAIGTVGAGVYKNGHRIDNNRDRIDAVHERITAVETRLSGDIANISERLTRIETLLEERLPARR